MKTKLISRAIEYPIVFLSPALLNIEGYISLYQTIFKKSCMNGIEIFELIALPVFFLGIYIYYNRRFDKQKKAIMKYAKKLSDADNKIIEAYSEICSRKTEYLYECIESNQILPEPNYINDYTLGLLKDWAKETDNDIAKIEKKLKVKLRKDELNRNIK